LNHDAEAQRQERHPSGIREIDFWATCGRSLGSGRRNATCRRRALLGSEQHPAIERVDLVWLDRQPPFAVGAEETPSREAARPSIIKETPVSALVDGDDGLGHVPARFGMQVAIDKAKRSGMAIVAVRNSAHFGATGYYTLMAANEGLIGMACTGASSIQVALPIHKLFERSCELGQWRLTADKIAEIFGTPLNPHDARQAGHRHRSYRARPSRLPRLFPRKPLVRLSISPGPRSPSNLLI
jgi:hypothetical protein